MDEYGESDVVGCYGIADSLPRVLSQNVKGQLHNGDPTLVIREPRAKNPGMIRKGSENALWTEGGADYLEISGQSLKAGADLFDSLREAAFEQSQMVSPSVKDITGAAQSAAAMRVIYAPTLTQCDVFREQYGELGARRILHDMLVAAKKIEGQAPGPTTRLEDGTVVQEKPAVDLGERTITDPKTGEVRREPRSPGTSEEITLDWPQYFSPTAQDNERTVKTAQLAAGGKALISGTTATRSVAGIYSIDDVNEERAEMEAEVEKGIDQANRIGPMPAGVDDVKDPGEGEARSPNSAPGEKDED